MNNESSSAVQKASFVLLLFIAAALAYLIVRERVRSREAQLETDRAAATANAEPPVASSSASGAKSDFAPLRPRAAPASAPVPLNRNPGPANSDARIIASPEPSPTPNVVLVPPPSVTAPVPAAFTSGSDDVSPGASLVGRVTLRGAPPPEKAVVLDALCGRLHPTPMTTRHFVVSEDAGLANVFVYVKKGLKAQSITWGAVPLLDNLNCEFQPYVLGVRAGQPFPIRNLDPTLHNVHSTSKGHVNQDFNIGLPVRGGTSLRMFEKPEVFVQIKCDVHPWMFAYVGVADHPWFAVTDTNGQFALPAGLPRGQYTVAAVHVKAGESTQEISITDAPAPPLSFTLDVPKALAQNTGR